MRSRWGVAVVAVAVVAACSDSNDNTADTTAAPTTSTEPPSTTAAVDEAELAQSALLTVDDMPTGWTEAPSDDNDQRDAETVQRISECSGLDVELIGDGVLGDTKAKSPEFSSPDDLASVKQTLGLASDEATASAALAAIGDDKLAPCYEEAMRTSFEEAAVTTDPAESLPDGMTLTDVTMERIDPPVTVAADDAVWYSAKATLDYQGQSIDIYLDLVFTRTGRVLSQIEFDGTTQPFPTELYAPTVTAAHEKIATVATV